MKLRLLRMASFRVDATAKSSYQEEKAKGTRRQAAYFSLVSPLDKGPQPKYKPHIHVQRHHDRFYVKMF